MNESKPMVVDKCDALAPRYLVWVAAASCGKLEKLQA